MLLRRCRCCCFVAATAAASPTTTTTAPLQRSPPALAGRAAERRPRRLSLSLSSGCGGCALSLSNRRRLFRRSPPRRRRRRRRRFRRGRRRHRSLLLCCRGLLGLRSVCRLGESTRIGKRRFGGQPRADDEKGSEPGEDEDTQSPLLLAQTARPYLRLDARVRQQGAAQGHERRRRRRRARQGAPRAHCAWECLLFFLFRRPWVRKGRVRDAGGCAVVQGELS